MSVFTAFRSVIAIVLLVAVGVVGLTVFTTGEGTEVRYMVFADAGSTGTRFYVYKITGPQAEGGIHPRVERQAKIKLLDDSEDPRDVPLASLCGLPKEQVWATLRPALANLQQTLPRSLEATPLYIWATAGMRVVPEHAARELYRQIEDLVRAEFRSFDVLDGGANTHIRTITGQEEGVLMWIAANWMLESQQQHETARGLYSLPTGPDGAHPYRFPTVGILDLGGGSAQAVGLLSDAGEAASAAGGPLDVVNDLAQHLYTRSYLGYGAKQLEASIKEHQMLEAANHTTQGAKEEIWNPCGFPGHKEEHRLPRQGVSSIEKESVHEALSTAAGIRGGPWTATTGDGAGRTGTRFVFHGTGEFDECARMIRRFLQFHAPLHGRLSLPPQAIHRLQPHPTGMRFLGFSLFYHVTHFLSVVLPKLAPFPNPTLLDIQSAGRAMCSREWKAVWKQWKDADANTPPRRLQGRCFDAALVHTLLGDSFGYGIPEDSTQVTFTESIGDVEVEWTLGALLSVVDSLGVRMLATAGQHPPRRTREARGPHGHGRSLSLWGRKGTIDSSQSDSRAEGVMLGVMLLVLLGGYAMYKAIFRPTRVFKGRVNIAAARHYKR